MGILYTSLEAPLLFKKSLVIGFIMYSDGHDDTATFSTWSLVGKLLKVDTIT